METARCLALQGIASLRFDAANVGDSPPVEGAPGQVLFSAGQKDDVQAAFDLMAARQLAPAVLAGRCSGAYLAFQSSLDEPRCRGVIAVNRPVTVELAEQVAEIFTEVIVAPSYEDGAVEVLARKKNIRVLRCPQAPAETRELRPIEGGVLVQAKDRFQAEGDDPANWRLAAGEALDEAELRDLAFAWRACRAVKSNAILLAKDGATVGVGMGQVNRVDSARLAVQRAGAERAAGSYAASDAFFPFPDGFEVLAEAGVRAVVQPGGSVRDEQVVEAAKAAGVTMYFTGTRHFFH